MQALQQQVTASVARQVTEALAAQRKELEAAAAAAALAAAAPSAEQASTAAAAAEAAAAAAKAEGVGMRADVTTAIEKKMHNALDLSLVTLRTEAANQAVAPLRKEFNDLRAAIQRNAQWLLQGGGAAS